MVSIHQETTASSPLVRVSPDGNRSVLDYATDQALSTALEGLEARCDVDHNDDNNNSNQRLLDWFLTSIDCTTTENLTVQDELQRLRVLQSYQCLQPKEEADVVLNSLTETAARSLGTPHALVSLVDLGRQYFCAKSPSWTATETARNIGFCSHVVLQKVATQLLIVPDTLLDERFATNPLVTAGPNIRFYAGAPLISKEGYTIGAFCLIDSEPHPQGLTVDQQESLKGFAHATMKIMEERRRNNSGHHNPQVQQQTSSASPQHDELGIAYAAHDLVTPLMGVQLCLQLLAEDEGVRRALDSAQVELLQTASNCADIMTRVCEKTIQPLLGSAVTTTKSSSSRRHSSALSPVTNEVAAQQLVEDDDNNNNNKLKDQQQQQQKRASHHLERSGHNKSSSSEKSPDHVNLTQLVKNLQLTVNILPKPVPIVWTVHDRSIRQVRCDETLVYRAVLNLLSAAVTRGSAGGKIHCRIRVMVKSNNNKNRAAQTLLRVDVEETFASPEFKDLRAPCLHVQSVRNLVRNQPGASCGFDYSAKQPTFAVGWFELPCETVMQSSQSGGSFGKLKPSRSYDDSSSHRSLLPSSSSLQALGMFGNFRCGSDDSAPKANATFSPSQQRRQLQQQPNPFFETVLGLPALPRLSSPKPFTPLSPTTTTEEVSPTPATPVTRTTSANQAPGPTDHALSSSSCSPATPVTRTTSSSQTPLPNPTGRALVIDDSLVVRKGLSRALAKLGYAVTQAVNGLEGLELLKATMYDLVLCDFLMPIMDGMDCVSQYRKWEEEHRKEYRQPIVGMSAHVSEEQATLGIQAGMDEFRPKPIRYQTLQEIKDGDLVTKSSHILKELGVDQTSTEYCGGTEMPQDRIVRSSCVPQSSPPVTSPEPTGPKSPAVRTVKPACLIAFADGLGDLVATMEAKKWQVAAASASVGAIELLKMRNWDAVLIDEALEGITKKIEEFRAWETKSRVNEQVNVFFLCSDVPSPFESVSVIQAPSGFNGVLPKPLDVKELDFVLRKTSLKIVSQQRRRMESFNYFKVGS